MLAADDLTGILQLFAAPPLVLVLIGVALAFDFINGFHDAANSVATVVATRAMPARWAPWFSAFFNFSALSLAAGVAACFNSL